jgi:hypothetical protein
MASDGGLRPLFRTRLRRFFWVPVETPISGGGVPDHHWCCDGVMGWNEYKAASAWKVRFRPEQTGWHETYARHGGRSFVIVRKQTATADDLFCYRGVDIRLVRDHGLKTDPLLLCRGGPSRWDWAALESLLLRPANA